MASEIEFLPLGAIIKTFTVDGTNIVQGFPTQELYVSHNEPFFGETIGRVANRVSGAKLNSLNGGQSYDLKANDAPNSLHGGDKGWGKRVWDGPKPVGLREIAGVKLDEGGESVEFTLRSEDGDMGYPGEVLAKIIYTTGTQKVDGGKNATVLGIEYEAELVGGAEETAINMTNHSYVLHPYIRITDMRLQEDGQANFNPLLFLDISIFRATPRSTTQKSSYAQTSISPSMTAVSQPVDQQHSPRSKPTPSSCSAPPTRTLMIASSSIRPPPRAPSPSTPGPDP